MNSRRSSRSISRGACQRIWTGLLPKRSLDASPALPRRSCCELTPPRLCDNASMKRLQATLYALLALLGAASACAAEEDNLLPVEQAFQVEAHAVDRATIKIDFKIADDYYLYRERMKTKSVDAGVTLGALDLPDGEKK